MKTAVFNVRMDLMALATIHKHYAEKGVDATSISSLARMVIEGHADALVSKLGATPCLSTADARNYFEERGLLKPLMTRGRKNLVKGLQEEALTADGFNPSYMDKKSKTSIDPDQYAAAKRALNKLQEQEEDEENSGAILGPDPGTIKKG